MCHTYTNQRVRLVKLLLLQVEALKRKENEAVEDLKCQSCTWSNKQQTEPLPEARAEAVGPLSSLIKMSSGLRQNKHEDTRRGCSNRIPSHPCSDGRTEGNQCLWKNSFMEVLGLFHKLTVHVLCTFVYILSLHSFSHPYFYVAGTGAATTN